MKPLSVTCPGCRARLKVAPAAVGLRITCPNCRAPLDAPGPAAASPARGLGTGLVVGFAAAGVVAAGLAAGLVFWVASGPGPKPRPEAAAPPDRTPAGPRPAEKPPPPAPGTRSGGGAGPDPAGDTVPAGERYAFLVGVRRYDPRSELRELPYAEPDVVELATVLRAGGYRKENVVLLTQTLGADDPRLFPSAVNVRDQLRLLLADRRPGDTVLVALAGHGVQFRDEAESYFCPVDARLTDRSTLLPLGEVYRELERCRAGFKGLLVDACRNDPVAAATRAGPLNLESVTRPPQEPPGGVLAFFSCSAGQVAFEDPELRHGVFFHHVIQGLRGQAAGAGERAVTFPALLNFVQRRVEDFVRAKHSRRQTPEARGVLRGAPVLADLSRVAGLENFTGGRAGLSAEELVEAGGTAESEAAVARGLSWLARQQRPAGNWSFDGMQDDIAATGLALLPFLAAGHAHRPPSGKGPSPYAEAVAKGLAALSREQGPTGQFGKGGMYGQAIAALAVCEAYGMTADPLLKPVAQRVVNYLLDAQHSAGGWRYTPGQPGDTSVTGWVVQALAAARQAGLTVPPEKLRLAGQYLDSVTADGGATYGYVPAADPASGLPLSGSPTPGSTASGLYGRQLLGWGPGEPALTRGVEYLKGKSPAVGSYDPYVTYYATQVFHGFGGDAWKSFWNPRVRDLLVREQTKDDADGQAGSWAVNKQSYLGSGGRLCATSFALLTLEVYYRHPRPPEPR